MSISLAMKNNNLVINSDLVLSIATDEDIMFLKELYNDPKIQSFALGQEEKMEITTEHVKATIESFRNSDNFLFIVRFKENPIGMSMLYELSQKNKHSKIGVALIDEYQNRGFGTVVVAYVANFAFEELGLNKVFGEVYDYNTKSISMLNKIGFEREGILKNHLFRRNRMIDVYIYSLFNRKKYGEIFWNK